MDQASGLRNIMKKDISARNQSLNPSSNRVVPRVIAVTSGKGGVGKTNAVGSLSVALQKMGLRVIILDADMGLGNVDIIFNLRPRYNISHVISGEKSLTDVMVETSHGVKIIPGGSGFAHLTQLSDGEKLNLLSEFEVMGDMADILLVDTGAGISSNVLYFNQAADECIVIATREPTSITDAYALMKVLSQNYGTRYFKLVVNMVGSEKEAKSVYASLSGAIDRFLGNVVLEYYGFIPLDPMMQKSVLKRSTIMDYAPGSPSGRALERIAKKLSITPERQNTSGNMNFFMKRIFEAAHG